MPSPVNILLVDDNVDNLLALEAILESLGQNLVQAQSGEDALKCLLKEDYAVILLDVQMPGIDGFETAEIIRKRPRSQYTPIIFLTASESSQIQVFKGYTLGAVDYLIKPIVPEILLSKVSVFIDLFQKTEEVKIANRELEKQAIQLREQAQLLDLTHDTIMVCDLNGMVQFWNRGAEQMYGWTKEEMLGKNPHEILQTEFSQSFEEIQVSLLRRNYWEGELINTKRGGERLFVSSRWSLQRDSQGNPLGILEINNDITQRKQAELEIQQALVKEKELHQLKSSFIDLASHEFRTPLTIILGSIQVLEHYSDQLSAEKMNEHLHCIQDAGNRMKEMIEGVLTLSRADSDKLEVNPTLLDLEQFCRNLIRELKIGIGEKHQIHFVNVENLSGSQATSSRVFLDEKLLRHILTNLLANAIKYSPPDTVIDFRLQREDNCVIFHVSDHGIGIPPEDQLHLFESFYRAKNTGNIPGTGLGLNIVKKYVDLQGGTINVRSKVGIGTTFQVSLPVG